MDLCRDRDISRSVAQVDVEAVSHIVFSNIVGRVVARNIVRDIHKLLQLSWEVRFVHVYLEANSCVDVLASIGCCQIEALALFEKWMLNSFCWPLLITDSVEISIRTAWSVCCLSLLGFHTVLKKKKVECIHWSPKIIFIFKSQEHNKIRKQI